MKKAAHVVEAPLPEEPESKPARKARIVRPVRPPCTVPVDSAWWMLHDDETRQRCGWWNAEGALEYVWPIAEFTVETVRERWGGGAYRAQFQDGDRHAKGKVNFRLQGAPKARVPPGEEEGGEETPAEVVASPVPLARRDPLEAAIQIFGVIDSTARTKAQEAIELQSRFLLGAQSNAERMFAAAMGREQQREAREAPQMDAIAKILTRIDERLTALEDGDPDDGDHDPDDDDARSGPEFPDDWDSVGQMIYRLVARQLPAIEHALPGLVKGWVEKVQTEAQARAVAAAAQGGVVS